jgi:homocysteine S-methyltransferase
MSGASGFVRALRDGVLVLDGGLSNQLEAQGQDLSDSLWSARLLRDDPGEVVAAHEAYFRAGARVAISASYQASSVGLGGDAERLIGLSVALAREAAERVAADAPGGAGLFVAGSVGPYGAVLADGSEYRGRYGLSVAELTEFHRPRAEALVAAGADVLALETVPDAVEAEALLAAVAGLDVPVWLSYSVRGAETRAGQPLTEAFGLVQGVDQVVAVGVNCCAPGDADAAVGVAREASGGKPVVVYPNSGEEWDAGARAWRGGGTFRAERVREWVAGGARLVGGCCRVGPAEISALTRAL